MREALRRAGASIGFIATCAHSPGTHRKHERPFANTGEAVFRNLLWAVERVNARGGIKLPGGARPLQLDRYDSKGQNEEAFSALRAAMDDGARIVLQGNSSATAAALVDAIDKNNERDPSRRVIFLNYAAVDPVLTNERCSFWHFRFDAHADMRVAALMDVVKDDAALKRVYLIGQDYSFGQAVLREARAAAWRTAARRGDRRRRAAPDGQGERLCALCQQDHRERCAGRGHRQLGQRPHAAGEGGARSGLQRHLLYLLRQCARCACSHRRCGHRPRDRGGRLAAQRADDAVRGLLPRLPRALSEAGRRLCAHAAGADDRGACTGRSNARAVSTRCLWRARSSRPT